MPTYYPISETTARQAKTMNSFSDYKPDSATAEYRAMVDKAAAIAEEQKARTDPVYHEKIDRLLDTYARKLAENLNENYRIQTRCPSILVAGGSNFPVRKKEKQNAASDRNMEEFRHIQGLLEKIRSTGMGGISSDDENVVEKLREKLVSREREQAFMKEVNAYYRKNKILEGCPGLTEEAAAELKASMGRSWRKEPKPYEAFMLSNNNTEIHRLRERIEELEQRQAAPAPEGWTFEGGKVVMNVEENRVQILFDGKPEEEIRSELKHSGFRWSPKQKAWQRQLNQNGIYAARQVSIRPAATWEEIRRPESRKIIFMDNNVLASGHRLEQIGRMGGEQIWVDFNQGLDARLITPDAARLLARLRWIRFVRMACDTSAMLLVIEQAAAYLKEAGVASSRFWSYVLVRDVEDAHQRVLALRDMGVQPFAQPYRNYEGGEPTDRGRGTGAVCPLGESKGSFSILYLGGVSITKRESLKTERETQHPLPYAV